MSTIPSLSPEESISVTLAKYKKWTGKDLVDGPLATKINDSPTAIYCVFEPRAQIFDDEVKIRLRAVVNKLQALSTTPAISEVAGIQSESQPIQLVFSSINTLLAVTKNDAANFDPLVDLFGYTDDVLKRLKIYPEVSVIPGATQTLVKIMTELVSVFAIATKDVKAGWSLRKYAKTLRGEIDVEKILCRLDRLTPEEAQRTVAPTLGVIYRLVHNMTRVMEYVKASAEGINQALVDIQRTVIEMAGAERHKSQEELRRWLSPPDPSTNHNLARKAHHDGTATWFINDNTFKQWKTTGGQLLWIYGTPGSGKTVLCSAIIHDARFMRETGLAAVGYFYVDFHDRTKQDAPGLLSSLLDQLGTQSDRFFGILSRLHAKHNRGGERPSEDELAMCLREMLECQGQAPVFIVIDALDECPDFRSPGSAPGALTPRRSVLTILKGLIELKLPKLHICLTSRPEFDIQTVLDPLEPESMSLHTQKGQLDAIAQYVESVVASDLMMRRWSNMTKKLVIDTLANKSQGMFRWASCQLENLGDHHEKDVPATLDALPSTLNDTYERMLQNIKEPKRKYALYIFQFLTVSARPLSVQELAEVFAISSVEELAGIPEFDQSRRESDAELAVRTACSSLISIDDVDGEKRVRFSHFSVQEFLTSNQLGSLHTTYHVLPRTAHLFSAQVCLGVLLKLNSRIAKDNIKVMFPLATYAAKHWVHHVKSGDASSRVQLEDGMSRLFDKKRPQFAAWIWVFNIDDPSGSHLVHKHPKHPEKGPLYYAALCGFLSMVEFLAKSHPGDVKTRGRDGKTPLHAALRNGHSDVALALLEKGANANAQDDRGETPLQIASQRGDIETMKSLFNHEANPDARNKDDESPLSLASSNGRLEAVELLLDRFPDLLMEQITLRRTALHVATAHGQKSIVRLLLDKSADINVEDENCRTPLHLAADHGKDDIARLLLQRGANVDVRDESELTPLHLASLGGQLEVAKLLLDNDSPVDVNAKDGDGWTALHMAAYNGYLSVVELLLQRRATPDSKNNDDQTPLELASGCNHTAVVEKLASVTHSP